MGLCLCKDPLLENESLKSIDHSTIEIDIKKVYTVGKVLGGGHFGVVRLGNRKDSPGEKLAIKSIQKKEVEGRLDLLKREIDILLEVDHPNIIRLYDTYENTNLIYMIMEYCEGGELFSRITEKEHLDESETMLLMKKMLLAVNHLHSSHIVHRDLKPENFLFDTSHEDAELKLVDFGLSNKFGSKFEAMHSPVGTIYYVAPEVLKGDYDSKCDLWSLGVIMHTMLSGRLPFFGENISEIHHKVMAGKFTMEGTIWDKVSDQAKELINELICLNPENRLSACQALNHPWFEQIHCKRLSVDETLLKSLQDYRKATLFQKEALNVLVKHLPANKISEMNQAFLELDTSASGLISLETLQESLDMAGFKLAKQEIEEILESIDLHKNGTINYSEFLAAVLYSKKHLADELILTAFRQFDLDGTGCISKEKLNKALKKLGQPASDEEIIEMLKTVQNPNCISFEEFRDLLIDPVQNKNLN